MTTLEEERLQRRVQLVINPLGHGVVQLAFVTGKGTTVSSAALAWPEQGRLIGSPPVDVENARKIREAAQALNAALDELAW